MKIVIQTDSSVQETSLCITCKEITPELERLISAFRLSDKKLSAKKNGEVHLIDLKTVCMLKAWNAILIFIPMAKYMKALTVFMSLNQC